MSTLMASSPSSSSHHARMSSSSSSCHSALVFSSRSCKYDVFLSFRGEDTRKTFVDHLYSALVDRQIHTYKDDQTLPRGASIGPSLFKAIEESHIAIIIFSANYANSSWCLEELTHIMKCKDERGLTMLPIFYDVDPSEVRKQNGKLGKAFAKHGVENINKVMSWRKALVDASKIAGWEPKNIANGHESTLIKRIVDTILDRLLSLNTEVDEDLVGMKTGRLQYLKTRLEFGSGGVSMVGIWGIGGGGKTTLATSVYIEIFRHFEGHYIVENIREESHKYGLKKLQENILSAVFKTKVEVHCVVEGKNMLKRMLCHSKVLILLDDVDDVGQLEALAGSHSWFGTGSRIIITTRDEHVLRTHKVDEVFPVTLLSSEEAIQLFNKIAYNEKKPLKDYETLSLNVVSYAAGLPLALKVLGSFLYDKDKEEWMSTLAKLKDIPETKILEQLKISYYGLENVEKELFLDIACFFRGESTEDAMEILEACDFHPGIGVKVLRQKALIDIVDGKFAMHDLVQEMGHYIVRGEQPYNPEKHSRVWKHEEINDMCFGEASMENDKIKAIRYYASNYFLRSRFVKIVSNMKELRWLSLSASPMGHGEYVEGPNFISNELRYIWWQSYPASSFPCSFQPIKLVVLRLHDSFQKELWKGYKRLPHLKVLQLTWMKKLLNTPDFDGLPSLQKLTLIDCQELEEIHPSLGNHRRVKYIKVSSCRKLKKFPTIVHMKKLETLEINGCKEILEFPEIQASMGSLVNLSLKRNGIRVLPSSIGVRCTYLHTLHLVDCFNLNSIEFNLHALIHLKEFKCGDCAQLKKMPLILFDTVFTDQLPRNLQKLDLGGCLLKDGEIPSNIVELSNLQELNLSWNDFTRLDFSLSELTQLKLLNLKGCDQLVELPELPSSIFNLQADLCDSLATVGYFYEKCKWLCQVSLTGGCVINDGGRILQSMLEGNAIENHDSVLLRLQGLEIANGFTSPLLRGSRCRLKLPMNWCNDFCGFLMCAVVCDGCHLSSLCIEHVMNWMDSEDDAVWEESDSDGDKYTWVWYASFDSLRHSKWWDETSKAVSFSVDIPTLVLGPGSCISQACRGFGVRLIASQRKSGPTNTSTTHEVSEFSHYTSNFEIEDDSRYALKVSF